jgi:hypothetical protein
MVEQSMLPIGQVEAQPRVVGHVLMISRVLQELSVVGIAVVGNENGNIFIDRYIGLSFLGRKHQNFGCARQSRRVACSFSAR